MNTRSTLGCLSTRLTYSSTARRITSRAESVFRSMDGKIARPQHVAQALPDRLEEIGLVVEMPVDLRLGGAGLLGDFPHAQLGSQPVDGAERRLDDFAAHLLAVFAPAFAARVDLHPGLHAGVGSGNSHHIKHHTAWDPLTWADWALRGARDASPPSASVNFATRHAVKPSRDSHSARGFTACRRRSPRPRCPPAPSAAAGCSTAS